MRVRVWWVVGTLKTLQGDISDVLGGYMAFVPCPDGVLPITTSASSLSVAFARLGAGPKAAAGIVSEDDEFRLVDRFRNSNAFLSLDVPSIVVVDASTLFFRLGQTWPKVRGCGAADLKQGNGAPRGTRTYTRQL